MLNEVEFVRKREPDWRRLTQLSTKADATPKSLSPQELREFVELYRAVSRDLALVRTQSGNLQLVDFLNDLCGKAYGIIYRPIGASFRRSIVNALTVAAQTVRRNGRFVAISAGLMVAGVFFSIFMLSIRPDLQSFFVPPGFEESFEHWKTGQFQEVSGAEGVMATAFYARNNPLVSIATGALSVVTFGIYGINMMWTTGTMLGALLHGVAPHGRVGYVLVSIMPHGVTELSGIVLAGAAGLRLGWALINPGRRKRGQSLMAGGKDAVIILICGVLLMFIAAPIEAFFSFNARVPWPLKLTVAVASAIVWGFFWLGYGRTPEEKATSEPAPS